jgi:hypothetical protein
MYADWVLKYEDNWRQGQDILHRWAVTVQVKVTETPFDVTTFLIMHVVKLEVLERQFDKI